MQTSELTIPYLPAKRKAKPYIMGIDPDADKSGVAIWSRLTDGYSHLSNLDFAELLDRINYYHPDELLIVVEAGYLNKSNWHLPPGCSAKKAAKIGESVGMNHATGKALVHFCRVNGYEVEEYRPTAAKWDANLFMRITGLKDGYNQEVRDAVRCIHGR